MEELLKLKIVYINLNRNKKNTNELALMNLSVNVRNGCIKLGIKNRRELVRVAKSKGPFFQKTFGNESQREIALLLKQA